MSVSLNDSLDVPTGTNRTVSVGIGIVGKEGKQASLAADFSIDQFSYLTKLLLWHGRNSYKRSAKLAQFVIHRGLIISVIQAVFSSIFFFARECETRSRLQIAEEKYYPAIAVYQGWLQVGYATLYTMAPVFSLVLDKDVSEDLALLYPELYKEMTKVSRIHQSGRSSLISLHYLRAGRCRPGHSSNGSLSVSIRVTTTK